MEFSGTSQPYVNIWKNAVLLVWLNSDRLT